MPEVKSNQKMQIISIYKLNPFMSPLQNDKHRQKGLAKVIKILQRLVRANFTCKV